MNKTNIYKKIIFILSLVLALTMVLNSAQTSERSINPPESIIAMNNIFKQIAENVMPSIVFIKVTRVAQTQAMHPFFRHFFRQREGEQPEQQHRTQGVGSGVIINNKGYIITNHHVIKGATGLSVVMVDNQEYKVQVVGVDEETDIAVLKMIGDISKIKPASLGDSDKVKPGEIVFALGNPFGLKGTITQGIVSATSRQAGESYGYDFIQTDAAINPGNSGGALVNIYGEVIGINRMIYTRTGGHMGIGFSIPINRINDIVTLIIKHGRVTRGYLGIVPANPDEESSRRMQLESGVRIAEVLPDSPAFKAGLKPWDIILSVNGTKIDNFGTLKRIVGITQPNAKIKITFKRGNKNQSVVVTLTERETQNDGSVEPGERRQGRDLIEREATTEIFGMEIKNLTPSEKRRTNVPHGVVVINVKPNTPAVDAGILRGDIILEIESLKLNSISQANEIIKSLQSNNTFQIRIKRGNSIHFIVIEKGR